MSPLSASIGYRAPVPGEPTAFIVGLGAPVEPPSTSSEFAAVDAQQIDGKWLRITLLHKVGGDNGQERVLAESSAFKFAAASGFVVSLPVLLENGDQITPWLRLTEQDARGFRDGAQIGELELGAVAADGPAPVVAVAPLLPEPARLLAPIVGGQQTYLLSISSARDGFSLTRRYRGRRLPKPAELPIPLPTLYRTLADQRDELNKESQNYENKYRDPKKDPLELRRDFKGEDLAKTVTHRMAQIGNEIYRNVLRKKLKADPRRRQVLEELRDKVPAGTLLEIENDKLVLPWNIVYDRDVPALENFDVKDLEGFWGYRFRICEPLSGGALDRNPPAKRVCAFVDPTLGTGPQPSAALEQVSRDHRQWLTDQNWLPNGAAIHLVPHDPAQVEDAEFMTHMGEELGKAEWRHILYFFCHGTGAATFDGDRFVGVEGGLSLSKHQAHRMSSDILQQWDDNLWEAVTDTEAVVFFNCCESAELDPFGVTGIVDAFELYLTPAAIIACNWEVPGRFAFAFAQRFLATYLSGQSEGVGEVIFQLRRELLEQFNPFGLIYSVYGDPSVCPS